MCAPGTLDPVVTARTPAAGGFLRRDGKNLTVKERLPDFATPVRVCAVSAALVEAPDDDSGAPEDDAEAAG